MSDQDARFEDGGEAPLRLRAVDADDLKVISTLTQDAVAQIGEISWMKSRRRLALLVNRFRWEDADAAERTGRPLERVQSVLIFDYVNAVKSGDLDPKDKDAVLPLIGITWQPGADAAGRILIAFSGEGTLAVDVECIDARLQDVSRPYVARAQRLPRHPDTDTDTASD